MSSTLNQALRDKAAASATELRVAEHHVNETRSRTPDQRYISAKRQHDRDAWLLTRAEQMAEAAENIQYGRGTRIEGYLLDEIGLHFDGVKLCGPLFVIQRFTCQYTREWAVEVAYLHPSNCWMSNHFPARLLASGAKVCGELASWGVAIPLKASGRAALVRFLAEAPPMSVTD